MTLAKRLSLSYVGSEDRILVVADDEHQNVFRLWLTQRLITQAVLALVGWLKAPLADDENLSRDLTIQRWEQAAAIAQYSPSLAVAQSPAASVEPREGLVTSIDLQHAAAGFALIFHLGSEAVLASHFTAVELRQWLSILYGLYQAAGWPLATWPTWFDKPIEGAAPSLIN